MVYPKMLLQQDMECSVENLLQPTSGGLQKIQHGSHGDSACNVYHLENAHVAPMIQSAVQMAKNCQKGQNSALERGCTLGYAKLGASCPQH
jgi:hypothetical protein